MMIAAWQGMAGSPTKVMGEEIHGNSTTPQPLRWFITHDFQPFHRDSHLYQHEPLHDTVRNSKSMVALPSVVLVHFAHHQVLIHGLKLSRDAKEIWGKQKVH